MGRHKDKKYYRKSEHDEWRPSTSTQKKHFRRENFIKGGHKDKKYYRKSEHEEWVPSTSSAHPRRENFNMGRHKDKNYYRNSEHDEWVPSNSTAHPPRENFIMGGHKDKNYYGNSGTERKTIPHSTTCEKPAIINDKVIGDFEKIFLNEEDTDVTLRVKWKTFKAHRNILRARSTVFDAMLEHNRKDNNTGVINIKDCEPNIFENFLNFLYSGKLEIITVQNATDLYRAADMYDVKDLMSECVSFMKSHISIDNLCDILTLALKHGETDLINQAIDFFARNMQNVLSTATWRTFLCENPIQGNDLILKTVLARKQLFISAESGSVLFGLVPKVLLL